MLAAEVAPDAVAVPAPRDAPEPALWTQAREQLGVTTVLINNAAYEAIVPAPG